MFLGIDFGTSGCRATIIDTQKNILAEASQSLAPPERLNQQITQSAEIWQSALHALFNQLADQLDLAKVQRIAIDGTSSSVLITTTNGHPISPALMYNDNSSTDEVLLIKHHSEQTEHLCMTASSSLAKAIHLTAQTGQDDVLILHQADFLSNYLSASWGISDYHNALKLGYDVKNLCWPEWVKDLLPAGSLPRVFTPGEIIGNMQSHLASKFGFSTNCEICAGSTDANAAFIATQCHQLGDAVTSLGSTLVLKILHSDPIQDLATGVYSHRLGDYWLCSGASNAGAAILRNYFSDQELVELSQEMNIQQSTGLNYYPLLSKGERFPTNDPDKLPQLEPRPASDIEFLQGMLEGLSRIEQQGYEKLHQLGTAKPSLILTSGGGAINPQWRDMRSLMLGFPVHQADNTQASFGSALLACFGLKIYEPKSSNSL